MADVHYQQPGLLAMPEIDGHGDTCGPIVMLDYDHVRNGYPLSVAAVDALRSTLISRGLFNAGMTMGGIVQGMHDLYGVTALSYVPWGQVNQVTLRSDLIRACTNKQAVFLETSQASRLPGNQTSPWVNNHFILAWGLDSNLGYWCCNGDTLTALSSSGPVSPVWYSWGDLQAASIQSYAVFPAVESNLTIIIDRNSQGQVTGAHDSDNPEKRVGAGMALTIEQKNQTHLTIEQSEAYFGPRSAAVLFAPSGGTPQVLTYSQQWNISEFGSSDLAEIVSSLMAEKPVTARVELTEVSAPSSPAIDTAGALADIEEFLAPLLDAVRKLSQ